MNQLNNSFNPLINDNQAHCSTCSLKDLCLPVALSTNDLDKLDNIIKRGRPIPKGGVVFRQGDQFESIFAVRTGTVKTYTTNPNGEEQITGFHLSSEIIGLGGYSNKTHPVSAKAVETTTVCEIPIEHLDELSEEVPELRKQLFSIMSKEIREDQQMMLLLGKKNAEERLATFLVSLSKRYKRRGFSANSFRVAMSRADMSNFLGLAVETISRVFTRFQSLGLVEVDGKDISLTDIDKLCDLSSLQP